MYLYVHHNTKHTHTRQNTIRSRKVNHELENTKKKTHIAYKLYNVRTAWWTINKVQKKNSTYTPLPHIHTCTLKCSSFIIEIAQRYIIYTTDSFKEAFPRYTYVYYYILCTPMYHIYVEYFISFYNSVTFIYYICHCYFIHSISITVVFHI